MGLLFLFSQRMVGFSLVPVDLLPYLPKTWQNLLNLELLKSISDKLTSDFIPKKEAVFKCLDINPDEVRVLIIGQDPYPNPDYAMGLAFSVTSNVKTLPASLRNIFIELESDLGIKRVNGDLSDWASQGVMLINRSLTSAPKISDSHSDIGWQNFTEQIIKIAADNGAVGLLWGNEAAKVSKLFSREDQVVSSHPSPLSAYRGFFGSKPFSKVNNRLAQKGLTRIKW